MQSAQSQRLTSLKKRIQAHAARSKAEARRLLTAAVIAGAMSLSAVAFASPSAFALDNPADQVDTEMLQMLSNPLRSNAIVDESIEQDRQAVSQELQYWVFSDDYCGWAAVKEVLKPNQSFANVPAVIADDISSNSVETRDHSASSMAENSSSLSALLDSLKLDSLLKPRGQRGHWSPIDPLAGSYDQMAIDGSLQALAAQEPVDVENSPMTLDCNAPANQQATVAKNSADQTLTSEEYQAYDLSRADQIALRMYPMSIPHFHYLGGRRTESRSAFDYDTASALDPSLDCLGSGSIWIEELQPSQSIEITRRDQVPSTPVSASHGAAGRDFAINEAWTKVADISAAVQQEAMRLQRLSDRYNAELAQTAVNAMQPDSEFRQSLGATAVGQQVASLQYAAEQLAEQQVQLIAQELRGRLDSVASGTPTVAPEQTAGDKLLLRAGIEANTQWIAAAGVADEAASRVCCPVEPSDIASQLPATYSLAAVGVATATLKTPHAPSDENRVELKESFNPVAQAEALATACDSAAASLESFARALRRAGDSLIRVARTGTDPGLTREPAAELR